MSSTTPRERLVAQVALLKGALGEVGLEHAWEAAESFVAGLIVAPDKPVACPCCEKQVVMCSKHYLLHEPGKKCTQCWDEQ